MIRQGRRWRAAHALLVTILGALAGCQSTNPKTGPNATGLKNPSRTTQHGPASRPNDPEVRLTKLTQAQEADIQFAVGRAAEGRGDLDQAMAAYRDALSRDQKRADAHLRLAILSDRQGKFHESADHFQQALKLSPGDPKIFCDMGYSLYLQHRWKEAELSLKQALAVDPDLRRAHNNLALVLAHTERPDEALAEFRRGGSDLAQSHASLAFALCMDRQWQAARQQYRAALAADPSSLTLRVRLQEFEALAGRLDKPTAPPARDSQVALTAAFAAESTPSKPATTPKPALDTRQVNPPRPGTRAGPAVARTDAPPVAVRTEAAPATRSLPQLPIASSQH